MCCCVVVLWCLAFVVLLVVVALLCCVVALLCDVLLFRVCVCLRVCFGIVGLFVLVVVVFLWLF